MHFKLRQPNTGEILVAWQQYKASRPDELSLHEGETVELIDTDDPSRPSKKIKLDPDLDTVTANGALLDAAAARHKLSVKPHRKHASSRYSPSKSQLSTRWLVRQTQGEKHKGWVPCHVLQSADDPMPGTGLPGDAAFRRQAVVKELVETEQEFVKDLDRVVQEYLVRTENAKVPKIIKDNLELVFGGLVEIADFHRTVLMEGVKYYANEPNLLGKAFLRLERDFDKHVNYCADEPIAQAFLETCDQARDFFDELSQKLGDDKTLSEHLKLPIQRINDYQLLLKELVRYSECLGEDSVNLQKALELMLSVPHRAQDEKFTSSIEGYRGSIHKLGRLISHNWFSATFGNVTKERYLFLFKARLLITKVRRISEDRSIFQLKDIIRLPQVEIKDHPDNRTFELVDKVGGHSLILATRQDHVKELWLKEIREFASDIEEQTEDFQLLSEATSTLTSEAVPVQTKPFVPPQATEAQKLLAVALKTGVESKKVNANEEKVHGVVVKASPQNCVEAVEENRAAPLHNGREEPVKLEETKKIEKSEINRSELKEQVVSVEAEFSAEDGNDMSRRYSGHSSSGKGGEEYDSSFSRRSIKQSSFGSDGASRYESISAKYGSESISGKYGTESGLSAKYSTESLLSGKYATESTSSSKFGVESSLSGKYGSEILSSTYGDSGSLSSSYMKRSVSHDGNDLGAGKYGGESTLTSSYTSRRIISEAGDGEGSLSSTSYTRKSSNIDDALTSSYLRKHSTDVGDVESSVYSRKTVASLESGDSLGGSKYSSKSTVTSTEIGDSGGSKYTRRSVSSYGDEDTTEALLSKYSTKGSEHEKHDTLRRSVSGGHGTEHESSLTKYSKYERRVSDLSRKIIEDEEDARIEAEMRRKYAPELPRGSSLERRSLSQERLATGMKRYLSHESIEEERQRQETATEVNGQEASHDGRPIFLKTLTGVNVEPGESAVFEVELSAAPDNLNWLKDNKPLVHSKRIRTSKKEEDKVFRLTIKEAETSDVGLYSAVATNSIGKSSCTAQLIVHELTEQERILRSEVDKPVFLIQLKDTELLEDTYLRFMVKVKGDPMPTVYFYKDDVKVRESNKRYHVVKDAAEKGFYELVIPEVKPEDAGVYRCIAFNQVGETTSEATVTVTDSKRLFEDLPEDPLLEPGEKPVFMWKRDGVPFEPEERFKVLLDDDQDSLALLFQHVRPEDAGLYTCVAQTSSGHISCSAELTVHGVIHQLLREPEKPQLVIDKREAVATVGGTVMLELQVKGYPKPQVNWKHDGQPIEPSGKYKMLYEDEESMSLVIKDVQKEDAGLYQATAQNELGDDTVEMTLNVKAPPRIKSKLEDVSEKAELTIKIPVEIDGLPKPTVKFYKDGHELKKTDRIKIVEEDETYTLIIEKSVVKDSGSYSVVATNEIAEVSKFWNMDIHSPPKINKRMGSEKIVSLKEDVKLVVEIESRPEAEVTWYKNEMEIKNDEHYVIKKDDDTYMLKITGAVSTDSSKYKCKAKNIYGFVEDDCQVNVKIAPKITKPLKDITVNEHESVEFDVKVEAFPKPTVKWYLDEMEITESRKEFTRIESDDGTKLVIKEVSSDLSGQYKCKVINELGETETSAKLVVNCKPRFIKHLKDTTVDEGATLHLEVEVEACPEPTVKWLRNGREVSADARIKITRDKQRYESYHLAVDLIKYEEQGEYEVSVTNSLGTVSSKSTVTVHKVIHSDAIEETEPVEKQKVKLEVIENDSEPTIRTVTIEEINEEPIEKEHQGISSQKHDIELNQNKTKSPEPLIEEPVSPVESKTATLLRKHKVTVTATEEESSKVVDEHVRPQASSVEIDEIISPIEEKVCMQKQEAGKLYDQSEEEIVKPKVQRGVSVQKDKGEDTYGEEKPRKPLVEDVSKTREKATEAAPTIVDSTLNDKTQYESLGVSYVVKATGVPAPTAVWTLNGSPIKSDSHFEISENGEEFKLVIKKLDMKDTGVYECKVKNALGDDKRQATLGVTPEAELRKPKIKKPLEDQTVVKENPAKLSTVVTSDPVPEVTWCVNGTEITPKQFEKYNIVLDADDHDIQDGLKECTFSLTIPKSEQTNDGKYLAKAKNKWGECECSAQLTIVFRPEIEGPNDVAVVPGNPAEFGTVIRANPSPVVAWFKNGKKIEKGDAYEIIEDVEHEIYKLKIKQVEPSDEGKYTVTAKNNVGESSADAKLRAITDRPQFITGLSDTQVEDAGEITIMVRADGLPKPEIRWFLNGKPIAEDERHTITTKSDMQVTSSLVIIGYNKDDSGQYKAMAINCVGEAETTSAVTLLQTAPTFGKRLERNEDVDEGEPLELKAKVTSSPKANAVWFKDGDPIPADDDRIKTTLLPDGTVKLNIDRALPSDSGAYKLVVKNPNGEASSLCAVAVNPKPQRPKFLKCIKDAKITVGEPLCLEARISAYPPPEIKWMKDGAQIRPSSHVHLEQHPDGTVALMVDCVKPENAGTYQLLVTNRLGESESDAKIEILKKPTKPEFVTCLQPMTVVEGFPAKLEVKAIGFPPPKISWTRNGVEIISDNKHIKISDLPDGSSALLIDACDIVRDPMQYKAVASNEAGVTETKGDLKVTPSVKEGAPEEAPVLLHSLRDVFANEGQPLVMEVPFTANPMPQVEWFKDGEPLRPSDRVLLTCDGKKVGLHIDDAVPSDAGRYSVKLVNPLGADESEGNAGIHKVYSPPRFTQKFTDLQQLPGRDGKLSGKVSGVPTPEVAWYKDGIEIPPSDKYRVKRDGDVCSLYINDCTPADAGLYRAFAVNKEGSDTCEAKFDVVDEIKASLKVEAPSFLKKIGDLDLYPGMTAKFTACATGFPEPSVEWFKNDQKLFPSDRIKMEVDKAGLLRLTISGIGDDDLGRYSCKISNEHGTDICHANLQFDELDAKPRKPISDEYVDYDKHKKSGIPVPLSDAPIISRMTDRHCTLSWKPSIPSHPRAPVTYQLEMCELPHGDWFTARSGIRNCVCTVGNLEPFRDYKFRVRVENKYGISDPSPYATTHREKLEPEAPKFTSYLPTGTPFHPDTSPYFPKDFDIERPPQDKMSQAPRFLRQEHPTQYGRKDQNTNLFWYVYGYPKPKMQYYFNDEPVESGGRFDTSYTRSGQATLFINKMLERDVGWYEAVATNEHGQARQRVRLEIAEMPEFIRRPDIEYSMVRGKVRFEARIQGNPYPEVKWYKDWKPLTDSSRVKIKFVEPDLWILTIDDVILKDAGLYSVSARNPAGTISSSAMLYVDESDFDYRLHTYAPISPIKSKRKLFNDYYDLGDELGRGTQGITYHAVERNTGNNYAAKVMHGQGNVRPFMYNELDMLNELRHRRLISLYDAYDTDDSLILLLELGGGGELVRDYLLKQEYYTEYDIAGYIRQLLEGVKYMHEQGYAHMGLNIGDLLLSHLGGNELKITDFGLTRRITPGNLYPLLYGVPEYVSPESVRGEGTGFAHDMWSIGIITHILLSGRSPFLGKDDRETLTRIRDGTWSFDMEWWRNISVEARDFISKLLVYDAEGRLDVYAALRHPWLARVERRFSDDFRINSRYLYDYFALFRDWYDNASCRRWFRRRPLEGAFTHPSRMVYPPGEFYTPPASPAPKPRALYTPKTWEDQLPSRSPLNYEIGPIRSESHYQNGPDTYLLQLRDVDFPVRVREYMKIAANRGPGRSLIISNENGFDWETPSVRERRRFMDIMDEEIDDERKERINRYGLDNTTHTIRRLRHELGPRLDTYAEAEALIESKQDGRLPFFREKPQMTAMVEGQDLELSCFVVGDPIPTVQWFKNDAIVVESARIKIDTDPDGRSRFKLRSALSFDLGMYKIVARNKIGQTVARTRIVYGTVPDAPDSPQMTKVSDTEILLTWKPPKYDGNSPVKCYSLQYKVADDSDWIKKADNVDHEFYLVSDLRPATTYMFRLAAQNSIGWSDQGVPTSGIATTNSGATKIQLSTAMKHLQQITDSGQEVSVEIRTKPDYKIETQPIEWSDENPDEHYNFISETSKGKFSAVMKGIDKRSDKLVVAKFLDLGEETRDHVDGEFAALRSLRHERVASLLAAYRTSDAAVFILEKLQGADVLTYLASRHEYTEQTVATIVTQVLDGLQYLHWRNLCHLDLQPDNVVMCGLRSVQIKLVDLGSAHRVTKLGTKVPVVGHPDYISPEVLNEELAFPQSDIWSVGVLTYMMLSGTLPFQGKDENESRQNISFVRYRFEYLFQELSQEGNRFIMQIFKRHPIKRPTAEECHENRWLLPTDSMIKKRERAVFLGNRLKEYSDKYRSEKEQIGQHCKIGKRLVKSHSIQEELLISS